MAPLAVLESLFAKCRDHVVAFGPTGDVVYRNPVALERALPADAHARDAFEWGERSGANIRYWYTAEVSPLDEGRLCISREVTAQKRVEDRLRRSEQMMVDTQGVAHLGTWEWDITQPTATWSAELYRIYGLTPETYTPSYEQYLTMVHDDDRQRVIDATNRVFHENVPYSHDERIRRPDGSWRWLHTWAFPLLDETGKLTHLIGVCQDITDRAAAEHALQESNATLEQRVTERTHDLEAALRDLESFSSMVTHDLRGPLAVISMAMDLVARDANLSSGSVAYLERGRRAVVTMSRLIEDLLAFAKVGKTALAPVELDVSAIAAELVAEQRSLHPEHDVSVNIAPDLRVTADPALFRLALTNLISNAWKYTGRATAPAIEIGSDAGRLYVRDNGIGFEADEAAKLFTPFSRLSSAVGFTGTGIGLATVSAIIQRHGGRVAAEGTAGQGATFSVWL
ncbi:MAG TPA: ATP-binding protein [Kofleriaceae bacterium]|jgi:PAS domain S-box-containing protein